EMPQPGISPDGGDARALLLPLQIPHMQLSTASGVRPIRCQAHGDACLPDRRRGSVPRDSAGLAVATCRAVRHFQYQEQSPITTVALPARPAGYSLGCSTGRGSRGGILDPGMGRRTSLTLIGVVPAPSHPAYGNAGRNNLPMRALP